MKQHGQGTERTYATTEVRTATGNDVMSTHRLLGIRAHVLVRNLHIKEVSRSSIDEDAKASTEISLPRTIYELSWQMLHTTTTRSMIRGRWQSLGCASWSTTSGRFVPRLSPIVPGFIGSLGLAQMIRRSERSVLVLHNRVDFPSAERHPFVSKAQTSLMGLSRTLRSELEGDVALVVLSMCTTAPALPSPQEVSASGTQTAQCTGNAIARMALSASARFNENVSVAPFSVVPLPRGSLANLKLRRALKPAQNQLSLRVMAVGINFRDASPCW